MITSLLKINGIYTDGRGSRRQVISLITRRGKPFVEFKVLSRRQGSPCKEGDVSTIRVKNFGTWAKKEDAA